MNNIYKVYNIMSLLRIAIISAVSLTSASCASESDMNKGSQGDVALKINMQVPSQTSVSTRAAILSGNESTVSNLTVLIFNSSNQLIGYGYSASPTSTGTNTYQMTVNTREATDGCTVYAVANAGANAFTTGNSTVSGVSNPVNTVDEFKAAYAKLSSASDLGSQSSVLMQGILKNQNINASTETLATTIPLYRLCTKINFNIMPASNITITGYQLHEVPASSYIADHSAEATPLYNPSGSYKDFDAVTENSPTNGSEVTDTYYIYENLAGKVTASNTAKARNSTNAPKTASYLDVYATGANWKSTYRIYLGGTGTIDYTNYNIPRNYNYTYTINITGSGIYDVRVTCYPELINSSTGGTWGSNGSATAVTSSATATVGDYYYSDGTWGSLANNPGKTPIAVIFSPGISGSSAYAAGYTHGLAIALTDGYGGGPSHWASSISVLQSSYNFTSASDVMADVSSGYIGEKTYGGVSSDYAFYYCGSAYTDVSATSSSSGWYLPSAGEIIAMYKGLGLLSSSTSITSFGDYSIISTAAYNKFQAYFTSATNTSVTPTAPKSSSYYWSSSEYSSNIACRLAYDGNVVFINDGNKINDAGYYRSILAF